MFTRLKNDVNGNPRFAVHFLDIEHPDTREALRARDTLATRYDRTVKLAHSLGGKKYTSKSFGGGGIVFQAYECQLPDIVARMLEMGTDHAPTL